MKKEKRKNSPQNPRIIKYKKKKKKKKKGIGDVSVLAPLHPLSFQNPRAN